MYGISPVVALGEEFVYLDTGGGGGGGGVALY